MKSVKIIVSGILLLALLVLTVGCSSDDSGDTIEERHQATTVEMVPYASGYAEVEAKTRTLESPSWAPDDFYLYSSLTGVSAMITTNIGAWFTSGTTPGTIMKIRRVASGKWLSEEEIANNNYYLYGFVPYGAAYVNENNVNTTSIEVNGSTYADGAKLTLRGLSSVSSQDVCVIVGAKDGTKAGDADPVPRGNNPMKAGDFSCNIGTGENYVFLLFDHLYAGLRFRFRVDDDYAKLRTIKLRKLELIAYLDEACTVKMTPKVKTTVTLKSNSTGALPIVGSVNFISDGGGSMDYVEIFSGEESVLSGKDGNGQDLYTDNVGFVPMTSNFYMLRSTYDVYDKKNNLVRSGCVAVNKINPRARFNVTSLNRGYMYTLKLTVQPTYLYMLSEPDLDNPTVEVN